VGRPPQELMRGWEDHPSVRLLDLTMDWEFRPHTIFLKKERKESVGVREKGRKKNNEECRDERQNSRDSRKNCEKSVF
jgi:hypothetical protein